MSSELLLKTALEAAEEASTVLMRLLGNAAISFKQEQTHNLVTEADVAAEKAILQVLQRDFPKHQVLGEEGISDGDLTAELLWIVDPLDGTTNYSHAIPQFSVSICFAESGVPAVGVVADPSHGEVFHAIRGEGAFLNGERIHVSTRADMREAVIATGFYYDRGEMMAQTLDTIGRLFRCNVRGIRRLGSAALDLCWVACGRLDGFFEYQLSPWDYAAAMLIVQEAGGRCANRVGEPLELGSGSVIATNGKLFDDISNTVRWDRCVI